MTNFQVLNFVLGILAVCKSQQLTVEYSFAKLPQPESCHRLHYDGDDSIYLLGGCYSSTARLQILKFSLESETTSQIGTLPENFSHGSLQSDADGNLFLFGAGGSDSLAIRVIKYSIKENRTEMVATLPWGISSHPLSVLVQQ